MLRLQMITTKADDKEWPDGFPPSYGRGWNNPVGDISIFVPLNSSFYIVSAHDQAYEYPIYSDLDER